MSGCLQSTRNPSGGLDFVPIRRSAATLYERWRTEPAGLFGAPFERDASAAGTRAALRSYFPEI
jgi:hypothetical protein